MTARNMLGQFAPAVEPVAVTPAQMAFDELQVAANAKQAARASQAAAESVLREAEDAIWEADDNYRSALHELEYVLAEDARGSDDVHEDDCLSSASYYETFSGR